MGEGDDGTKKPPGALLRERPRDWMQAAGGMAVAAIPVVGGPLAQLATTWSEHGIRKATGEAIQQLADDVGVKFAELRLALSHFESLPEALDAFEETVVRVIIAQAKTNERVAEDLAQAMKRPELRALVVDLVEEATRSALEDRRRMLAAAAVGILTADLVAERKSRAERALKQLEASDAVALKGLLPHLPEGKAEWLSFAPSSFYALEAAQCIAVTQAGSAAGAPGTIGRSVEMTEVGRDVLALLAMEQR